MICRFFLLLLVELQCQKKRPFTCQHIDDEILPHIPELLLIPVRCRYDHYHLAPPPPQAYAFNHLAVKTTPPSLNHYHTIHSSLPFPRVFLPCSLSRGIFHIYTSMFVYTTNAKILRLSLLYHSIYSAIRMIYPRCTCQDRMPKGFFCSSPGIHLSIQYISLHANSKPS